MGLLSTIGKLAGTFLGGPVGGLLGGAIGGQADANREKRAASRAQRNYYVELADAARRGGFHPLEALRSGGGAGYGAASMAPRIVSNKALAGLGDSLVSELDGSAERERQRERREHELFMIRSERELAGGAQTVVDRTRRVRGGSGPVTRYAEKWPKGYVPGAGWDAGGSPRESGPQPITSIDGRFEHPFLSDAETAEARSGDIMENVYGISNEVWGLWYRRALARVAKAKGISQEDQHRAWAAGTREEMEAEISAYWSDWWTQLMRLDSREKDVLRPKSRPSSTRPKPTFKPSGRRRAEDMGPLGQP